MQPPFDPVVAGLLITIVGLVLGLFILLIKLLNKTRKPYQFTDDITDLNLIFTVKPKEVEEEEVEEPRIISPAPPPMPMPPTAPKKLKGNQYE